MAIQLLRGPLDTHYRLIRRAPRGRSPPTTRSIAVAAVEAAKPLFHLLNGDLCYANLNYNSHPAVWRDFFTNLSKSAANRPWLPCLGNHEIEWGTTVGASGLAQYNGRQRLWHLSVPLRSARQRGRRAQGQLLQLPGRHGAVHLARRRRRHLPGRRIVLGPGGRRRAT